MKSSILKILRIGIIKVMTIAKPENIAPATKKGGSTVVCQPGRTEIAKSKLTTVWTETTSGVAMAALAFWSRRD